MAAPIHQKGSQVMMDKGIWRSRVYPHLLPNGEFVHSKDLRHALASTFSSEMHSETFSSRSLFYPRRYVRQRFGVHCTLTVTVPEHAGSMANS